MEKNDKSVIESLLFVSNEPLSSEKIATILQIPPRRVRQYLDELISEYEFRGCGIQIIQLENAYQMTTLRENHPYVETLTQKIKNQPLSQSALEVLAIIAYKQPITRSEIESIRGVKSDKPMSTLMEKELIEEKGFADRPGKPMLFGTSETFLKAFGFVSTKELPDLSDLLNEIEQKNMEDPV